jgi:glycosyltransferase involved in cell wall biosynthesis
MTSHYKIIHTTCHDQWGGLEKQALNQAAWMSDKGHQVVMIAPDGSPLFQRAKKLGLRVYAMSFRRMNQISNYRDLVRIFLNEQPHVLTIHGDRDVNVALLAAHKTGIPCRIFFCHSFSHVRNSWITRRLCQKYSHYVFSPSAHAARFLQSALHLKDTQVIPMPGGILLPDNLMPWDVARNTLAKELKCAPETRFIGTVGHLSREWGVATLIRAFKQIQSRVPHHLVLAGDGTAEYQTRMAGLARDLGIHEKTHFIGEKASAWPVYRALDCHILAWENIHGIRPQWEIFSLLKAMYSSCPVIGSRTGEIPDIIHPGENGLLFDPGDAVGLAEQVLDTLDREAATLERIYAAREKVRRDYTMDAMGRNILRIYRLHQVRLEKQKPSRHSFS